MNKLLINIAVGDAFGFMFEGKSHEYCRDNMHKSYGEDRKIVYSDDTQMSLAIAEHMINQKDFPDRISHNHYALHFLEAYQRDPRAGYSRRVKSLVESETAQYFVDRAMEMPARNSNGCVMRIVPLGLYPTVEQVKKATIINVTLTHASLECIQASLAVSLTAHYLYHDYTKEKDYDDFMLEHLGNFSHHEYNGSEIPCDAMTTALFCIQKIREHTNFRDLLFSCIETGGDVDSTAAVCMGLASLDRRYMNNLSPSLYENLENGPYGSDYLIEKDRKLFELFPRK